MVKSMSLSEIIWLCCGFINVRCDSAVTIEYGVRLIGVTPTLQLNL